MIRFRRLRNTLSLPFIYSMIIPLVILDVFLEIYNHICFPLYGIPIAKRGQYIRIDRHKLPFLTDWQKLNCAYCSYANGLVHYSTRIAVDTERYWCPIKHQMKKGFIPPKHHEAFAEWGDEKGFQKRFRHP